MAPSIPFPSHRTDAPYNDASTAEDLPKQHARFLTTSLRRPVSDSLSTLISRHSAFRFGSIDSAVFRRRRISTTTQSPSVASQLIVIQVVNSNYESNSQFISLVRLRVNPNSISTRIRIIFARTRLIRRRLDEANSNQDEPMRSEENETLSIGRCINEEIGFRSISLVLIFISTSFFFVRLQLSIQLSVGS